MVTLELDDELIEQLEARIYHSFEILTTLIDEKDMNEVNKIFLNNVREDLLIIREILHITTEDDLPW